MTDELTPHPLAKWIKYAADGRVVRIRQNGTWDEWFVADLQTLCSINPEEYSFELVAPRERYMVMLFPDGRLMHLSDTQAGAQKWLDESTACPEKYEIYHAIEVFDGR